MYIYLLCDSKNSSRGICWLKINAICIPHTLIMPIYIFSALHKVKVKAMINQRCYENYHNVKFSQPCGDAYHHSFPLYFVFEPWNAIYRYEFKPPKNAASQFLSVFISVELFLVKLPMFCLLVFGTYFNKMIFLECTETVY